MADTREMRIFAPEQIEVNRDLPQILKDYSKEVIRSGPENILQFSREYFESILKKQGYFETGDKKPKKVIEANEGQFVWRESTAKITDHYKLLDNISEVKKVRAAVHKVSGAERSILQKPFKVGTPEREALKTRIIEHSARFDHRSLVKLIEVFEDEQNLYIVTEGLKGVNVIENIWKQAAITEGAAARIIAQILEGVRYMHSKNVAHNQLNPTNIHHLNPGPMQTVKIIDFDQLGGGKSFYIKDIEKLLGVQKRENACYLAPELIKGEWHIRNDEWSVGVLMYTMLTGMPPFTNENYKDTLKQIQAYKFDQQSVRWNALSDEARDLILNLMAFRPEDRLDALDALKHQWFQRALKGDFDSRYLGAAVDALKNFHSGSSLKQAVHSFFVQNLLTQGELNSLASLFQNFDRNGNGRLSRAELIEGFRQVRGVDFNEKDIDQLIQRVDINGSGDIDYQEFVVGAFSVEKILTEDRLERAFHLFDANGDNLISYQEIKTVLDSAKESTGGVDDAMIDKALKDIGKQAKNVQLTFAEFKSFIKSLFSQQQAQKQ